MSKKKIYIACKSKARVGVQIREGQTRAKWNIVRVYIKTSGLFTDLCILSKLEEALKMLNIKIICVPCLPFPHPLSALKVKGSPHVKLEDYVRMICVFLTKDIAVKIDFVFRCYDIQRNGYLVTKEVHTLLKVMLHVWIRYTCREKDFSFTWLHKITIVI